MKIGQSAQQYWGKFKGAVIDVATDPVKLGVFAGSTIATVAISAKMDDFLYKGLYLKYKWLGFKQGKVPVVNWDMPYPAIVDKKATIMAAMKGKPELELKRNLIAGATGTAVSAVWIIPTYKFIDKDLGKIAAVGSGINMLFWACRGVIQYAGAKIKSKLPKTPKVTKAKVPVKTISAKDKALAQAIKKLPPGVKPSPQMIEAAKKLSKLRAPAMPKINMPKVKMPKMPQIKMWGEFRNSGEEFRTMGPNEIALDGQMTAIEINPPRTPLPDDVSNFQQEEYAQANDEPAMAQDYYGDEEVEVQSTLEDAEPEGDWMQTEEPTEDDEEGPVPVPWGG